MSSITFRKGGEREARQKGGGVGNASDVQQFLKEEKKKSCTPALLPGPVADCAGHPAPAASGRPARVLRGSHCVVEEPAHGVKTTGKGFLGEKPAEEKEIPEWKMLHDGGSSAHSSPPPFCFHLL